MKNINFADVLASIPRLTKEENERIMREQEKEKKAQADAQLIRKWAYFKSNMPKTLEKTRLTSFTSSSGVASKNQTRIIEEIKKSGLLMPKNSVFFGNVGLGKTWFASALGRGWMINNPLKWAKFITESDFVKNAKNNNDFFDSTCTDDILVFDDITGDGDSGMIEKWDAKKVRQMLFSRFENKKVTLLTTNMSIEALEAYLGARIWSRMSGTKTTFINFGNSQDLRKL